MYPIRIIYVSCILFPLGKISPLTGGARRAKLSCVMPTSITHLTHSSTSKRNPPTTQITREKPCCLHFMATLRIATMILFIYSTSHIQYNIYHDTCYTRCRSLAVTGNIAMDPPRRIDPTMLQTLCRCTFRNK